MKDVHLMRLMNFANFLTIFRIILSPILCLFLLSKTPILNVLCLLTFLIAFFTDFLDGFFARHRNKTTELGKFLDPVADKILTFLTMICLVKINFLSIWVVIFLLIRDFLMAALRLILAQNHIVCSANIYGKVKTLIQFFAIFLIILLNFKILNISENIHKILLNFSSFSIWLSVVISILSFFVYIFENKSEIKKVLKN